MHHVVRSARNAIVRYRIYKAAGLAVERRKRRKLRAARPAPPVEVVRPNRRWSMDFVHDYLADGRRLRTFNVAVAFKRFFTSEAARLLGRALR